jgi:SAM-dependent methyltransferase
LSALVPPPRSRRLLIELVRLLDRAGLAGPAFRTYERLQAVVWRSGVATVDGLPLPPADLRYMVAGTADPDSFIASGRAHAERIRAHLGEALEPPGRMLDFGVGCGRIARHWRDLALEIHGSDYNPRLVAWVQEHLPFVRARRNELAPPLGYPSDHFDVVYAFSVLTHLSADLQVAWMRELARLLAPEGRLLVTTHGAGMLEHMLADERERFAAGELVVRNVRARGSNLCAAYHPPDWVRAHLLDGLAEVMWTPGDLSQDVWVLRRKP